MWFMKPFKVLCSELHYFPWPTYPADLVSIMFRWLGSSPTDFTEHAKHPTTPRPAPSCAALLNSHIKTSHNIHTHSLALSPHLFCFIFSTTPILWSTTHFSFIIYLLYGNVNSLRIGNVFCSLTAYNSSWYGEREAHDITWMGKSEREGTRRKSRCRRVGMRYWRPPLNLSSEQGMGGESRSAPARHQVYSIPS